MSPSLLCTRFAASACVIRSEIPLTEDQMRRAAPSVFAPDKHASRSERYAYIPTIDVLRGLRREGFEPFMAAQSRSRLEGRSAFTKHMIRLRHAGQVQARGEAQEIILINSHDGASSYQMLAGVFRFVCHNGLVVGEVARDIRLPHKGNVQHRVIEGAYQVLGDFAAVEQSTEAMKALPLTPEESIAFARAALALRYGAKAGRPAPICAEQLDEARRIEDQGTSLWCAFNRVQENALRGGQPGYTASQRRMHTRGIVGIDRNVALNRALWVLAEEMRRLKTA